MQHNHDTGTIQAEEANHGIGNKSVNGEQDQPSTSQYTLPIQRAILAIRGRAEWIMEDLLDFFCMAGIGQFYSVSIWYFLPISKKPDQKKRQGECT